MISSLFPIIPVLASTTYGIARYSHFFKNEGRKFPRIIVFFADFTPVFLPHHGSYPTKMGIIFPVSTHTIDFQTKMIVTVDLQPTVVVYG